MANDAKDAKKGTDPKIIVFAAVVIVAALAAAGYYMGFFNGAPSAPAEPASTAPLATPEARLLLASFDKGAGLADYSLRYIANDNGAQNNYTIIRNGSLSYVGVQGAFGKMYGFFGKDNSTDMVCLEYKKEAKCALSGNQSDMADIASSLKILRPTPLAYLNQKDDTRKLIAAGAIRLDSGMAGEKVGGFDTQKISYALDYSNLTVQQMVSLGMSPNDRSLLSVTDQRVTFWIDSKTGLMVKSHASYVNLGTPGYYDTEYAEAASFAAPMPEKPSTIVATEAFVDFYSKSTMDYSERAACFAKAGAEQDTCLKSIAANAGDWETCKLIKTELAYESCSVIVAQGTKNSVICGLLPTLADDCYISVAGETGNFELCKSVKNTSLSSSCIAAATSGQKNKEAADAAAAKAYAGRNCADGQDCKVFGNSGQYCAPKNSTAQFAADTSPIYACLKGTPCGCLQGYCGFAKNETYYSCMNNIEDENLRAYINSFIPGNSSVKNITEKLPIGG
ncbi:MAG: hypothetical protein WC263_04035 [Candidatus Micrarchaeia archaeon]|jgi:hypothetical protein